MSAPHGAATTKRLYLLHVLRRRMDYPDLKRAVQEQCERFRPTNILIEDKASGTQLIQELIREGMYGVTRYEPPRKSHEAAFGHQHDRKRICVPAD